MDSSSESEDWEKQKRIKAEIEKAEKASRPEDKSKLAYIDPSTFTPGKGLSYNIEAYRTGSEKISTLALTLIILGVIGDAVFIFITAHLQLGLVDMLPQMIDNAIYTIFVLAPAVAAAFAIVEAIIYMKKTGHKLTNPIINSVITIVIFLIWQSVRLIIAGI